MLMEWVYVGFMLGLIEIDGDDDEKMMKML